MKLVYGDIFDLIETGEYDGFCITTNGFVKANGECVMGRGIALKCKQLMPALPKSLGLRIQRNGNHVYKLGVYKEYVMFSFPVKHNWWETADIELIVRSCVELTAQLDKSFVKKVLLPRPGCGNGHLNWTDVEPVISQLLDDRVYVATFKRGAE